MGSCAVRFPAVVEDILRACIFVQAIVSPPLALLGYSEWSDAMETRFFAWHHSVQLSIPVARFFFLRPIPFAL